MTADLYTRLAQYGVRFEGEQVGPEYHEGVDYAETLTLAEVKARGGRITRVRILQERGLCDISYIHATLPSGKTVPVNVQVENCTPRRQLKKAFIDWARRERVYAKGLGLLDEGTWSVLR